MINNGKSIVDLFFSSGVHLNKSDDPLGQQYVTPEQAIGERGADILIVGRGILDSKDRIETCEKYQREGYRFYEEFHGKSL